jgi:hypothetical protein
MGHLADFGRAFAANIMALFFMEEPTYEQVVENTAYLDTRSLIKIEHRPNLIEVTDGR